MLAAAAGGCGSDGGRPAYVPQIVTPYRIDIQQGNYVTQDMVDKLAVGQTREQVRFILGTPLLTDIFHPDRWDYLYRFSKGWNAPERRKLVVHFDAEGRLLRWEADVPPVAVPPQAAVAPASQMPPPAAAPPAPATPGAGSPGAVSGASNLRLGTDPGADPAPARKAAP